MGEVNHQLEMLVLVEDSSDEDGESGEDEGGGEDDDWGPSDDAPVGEEPVGEESIDDTMLEGAQEDNEPRHSNRERRGVPPLRNIEMYLAAAAEEEAQQSPQSVEEALKSAQRVEWEEAMNSEMNSLKENGVYELVRPYKIGSVDSL